MVLYNPNAMYFCCFIYIYLLLFFCLFFYILFFPSFPGGLADTADHSPRSTALREAEEELGIKSCDVDIWGQLNSVPDATHWSPSITPVLGYVRNFSFKALKLNHAEVR